MAQDDSEDAPRGPKAAPRRLQGASGRSNDASNKPGSFNVRKNIDEVRLLAIPIPIVFRGFKLAPRWPKRAPI
eukprot:3043923-Pyramimonas_sp.AAC.1